MSSSDTTDLEGALGEVRTDQIETKRTIQELSKQFNAQQKQLEEITKRVTELMTLINLVIHTIQAVTAVDPEDPSSIIKAGIVIALTTAATGVVVSETS